jgi:hypothetical protein
MRKVKGGLFGVLKWIATESRKHKVNDMCLSTLYLCRMLHFKYSWKKEGEELRQDLEMLYLRNGSGITKS